MTEANLRAKDCPKCGTHSSRCQYDDDDGNTRCTYHPDEVILPANVTAYAADHRGFRRLSVALAPGIDVSVAPTYVPGEVPQAEMPAAERAHQRLAEQIAATIADHGQALAKLREELESERRLSKALLDAADQHRAQLRQAQEQIKHLTSPGKQRLFGRARVRIVKDGVWLLDPVKDSRGFGFWYPSLADLWRVWPDLRPVECGQDDDSPWMLVESQPIVPKS